MKKGKVIFFNEKSKFGFIREDDSENNYYFKINNKEIFRKDELVVFDVQELKRGPVAINLKKAP